MKSWYSFKYSLRADFSRYLFGIDRYSKAKTLFMSVGFTSVIIIRLQNYFYGKRRFFIAYSLHRLNLMWHGIDVLPGCSIGPGIFIQHPSGIVIGSGVVIGKNVTIMQGTTIGLGFKDENWQMGYPVIGDNVAVMPNCVISGNVVIGENSLIGANSVVLNSFGPNSKIVGAPARLVH
jgi:serine O-acetyltransferase